MRQPAKEIPLEMMDYVIYDETSPSCLRWKVDRYMFVCGGTGRRRVVSAGDVAGHLRKDGYWSVKWFCESVKIHRIIYGMHHGFVNLCNIIIDHVDGDSSNNKITNLVDSSDYHNCKNKAKYKSNHTGVTGVHLNEKCPGKFYYVATWRFSDKRIGAKSFSFTKYGKEEAFRLACEYRAKMLDMLKEQNVGYTERHGT
jgi:hypothetical protein